MYDGMLAPKRKPGGARGKKKAAATEAAAEQAEPSAAPGAVPAVAVATAVREDSAVAVGVSLPAPALSGSPLSAAATEAAAAAAAAAAPAAAPEEPDGEAEAAPPAKRKRKVATPKPPPGPVFEHSMRPAPLDGPGFRIMSWNVAGLRALLKEEKKVDLGALVAAHSADVVCLQEIKLQEGKHCEEALPRLGLEGWHCYWNCSTARKGYSGTALISRHEPLSVSYGIGREEHDSEGRVVTAEFDSLYVVNCYTPNSGDGLKRLEYRVNSWDKDFSAYVRGLSERKGVVVAGDLNCAHQEIDIHNPKGNRKSAGFTQEERDSFAANLLSQGFVDAFRHQYPDVVGYTYWGYRFNLRAKNAGWRLDYALVSDSLLPRVHECYHAYDVLGSDHCPVVLVLRA
ncbi:hypothetical protein N2152v2_008253 [Parachlorella kessleri]